MPDETVWEADPHTFMKHHILRKYLEAWYPVLASISSRLVFVDGFAGPGEYLSGQPGSPVVALDALTEHKANLSACEFVFLFIEERKDRAEHLSEILANRKLPKNVKHMVVNDSFTPAITNILDGLDAQLHGLAPSFVMIDPFGWTGFPHALIKRLARHARSEVLVSFMFEQMNRLLVNASQDDNLDDLFGTTTWRAAAGLPSAQRKVALLDLYRNQLQAAGFKYTYAFELRDKQNKTEYFLVHGTKNLTGLDKMKQAMWSADHSGNFSFSDWAEAKHAGQMTLIGDQLDDGDVRRRVCEFLKGRDWTDVNGAMLEWLLLETPYHSSQFKRAALAWLEKEGVVEVERPAGKSKAYWNNGTKVRLLNR